MQCHTKLHNVVHQGKKIVACFVQSVETSPVCQININPSSLTWNEKICVVNKNKEIKSPNASLVERTWFHVQSLSCLQSFVWWSGHCIFRKKSLVCRQKLAEWGWFDCWDTKMELKFTKDGLSKWSKFIFLFVGNYFSHALKLAALCEVPFSVSTGTKVLFLLFYYQN